MTFRLSAFLLVVMLGLAGCPQGGTEASAAAAADSFLSALVQRDVDEAWSHLTPKTKQVIYENVKADFKRDVDMADWSRMVWQMGAVSDLDISWGVHVAIDAPAVPAFLVERQLVSRGPLSRIMILLVQIPGDPGEYLIAGQGLDIDLR